MIEDGAKYIMMIEPHEEGTNVNVDSFSKLAKVLFDEYCEPIPGTAGDKVHTCICGERSDNQLWQFPNGQITNSLFFHYVLEHRQEIPWPEMDKLVRLAAETLHKEKKED